MPPIAENLKGGMLFIYFLFIMLIHLMLPVRVQAQARQNIKFSQITVADGLSHHEALFVTQDTQGFMWFGMKQWFKQI